MKEKWFWTIAISAIGYDFHDHTLELLSYRKKIKFRKEALAAAGLNHPGIVSVYDSGEEPAPYIVMELVSGHTLRDLIHNGERVPLKRALEIGEGILAALDYSHERGIVHRDIKPANIMMGRGLNHCAILLSQLVVQGECLRQHRHRPYRQCQSFRQACSDHQRAS